MKKNAQATIEFTLAFICTILFLILSCNLFVWMNHCLVGRQRAYEDSRQEAGAGLEVSDGQSGTPGKADFYTPPKLDVFSSGGR